MIEALSESDLCVERDCYCNYNTADHKPSPTCINCSGVGAYPTEFGEAIITMLRHQGLVVAAAPEEIEE